MHTHPKLVLTSLAVSCTSIFLAYKVISVYHTLQTHIQKLYANSLESRATINSLNNKVHGNLALKSYELTHETDEAYDEYVKSLDSLTNQIEQLHNKIDMLEIELNRLSSATTDSSKKADYNLLQEFEKIKNDEIETQNNYLQLIKTHNALHLKQKCMASEIKQLQDDSRIENLTATINEIEFHLYTIEDALDRFVVGRSWRKLLTA